MEIKCAMCSEDISNVDYVVTTNKETWCTKCWILENDVEFNILNLL
jgi:hypothetical protein